MKVSDIVKNKSAYFVRVRQGVAYFKVMTPGKKIFPVPLDEIGGASLE